MKHILCLSLIIAAFLTGPYAFAQKPFQGKIDYTLASRDSSVVIDISSWYRKDRICFIVKKTKLPKGMESADERIILNFKDGFIERIKDNERKVEREPLTGPGAKRDLPVFMRSDDTLILLGQRCHRYSTPALHKEVMKDSMNIDVDANASIWYADDLLFPVPDSMKTVQMVPLFTNGHIALGSNIAIKAGPADLQLQTRARQIVHRKVSASMFRVPKGYVVEDND